MWQFSGEDFVPLFIFAIPIVAIVGGITAGIVRTLGQQRLIELAQRERLAAIDRGIDPRKLPPLPVASGGGGWEGGGLYASFADLSRRRAQGLLIGGLVCLFVGVALAIFLWVVPDGEDAHRAWAVGLIPASVGLALLIGAMIVRPKDNGSISGPPPGPRA
jgi:hypothetical protein